MIHRLRRGKNHVLIEPFISFGSQSHQKDSSIKVQEGLDASTDFSSIGSETKTI
ncbi:MAG: hypothetical protein Q7S13_04580 [Candidatus Omnitrophota bacterium]|nr:hypothetical protein [Candidatus Omnitrophota bacterium]